MAELHEDILESYHDGHWVIKTWIDGSVVEAIIETSENDYHRAHQASKITYHEDGKRWQGDLRFSKLVRPREKENSSIRKPPSM